MSSLPSLVFEALTAVMQGKIPPVSVLKLLISKLLGIAILGGSCINKLPQIRNLLASSSAAGLSPLSFELETVGLIIHSSYGFLSKMSFGSYGETVILAAQNLVILALVYRFAKLSTSRVMLVGAVLVGLLGAVFSGHVTPQIADIVFQANSVLVLCARVPQILKNQRGRNTGQLSVFNFAMNVAGNVARIFTSTQEGGGWVMVRGYILS
ncbi:MAG: hypothetical protein WDW38_005020 [Sanguina aurantia]